MTNAVRLAIATAAAIVVAVVAINVLQGPTNNPALQAGSPKPVATPSGNPRTFTTTGQLGAGRYLLHAAGGGSTTPIVSVEVPNGWEGYCNGGNCFAVVPLSPDAGPGSGVSYAVIANVYSDPCAGVLSDPPIGQSVDDAARAISGLPGTDATRPIDITFAGHAGKYVELTVRDDIECAPSSFHLWQAASGGSRWAQSLGQHFSLWILDVVGQRVFIDAVWGGSASPATKAQMLEVVDSIQFGP